MPLIAQNPKPRVILGLMTFGPDESAGGRITSLDEYNRCLDHFQSRGYNEVDTARLYINGQQEAFTRQARWQERGLTLATKCYPWEPGQHSPEKLTESLETSLKELGVTDHQPTAAVDIFYLHAADRSVPFETTLRRVDALHRAGKFARLGLSNFTAFEVAEVVMTCRQHGWVRPSVYQGMYNAVTRGIEAELVPACRRYGLDIVVYNPLAGGIFSGKYSSNNNNNNNKEEGGSDDGSVPADGRFSDKARSGAMYRARYFKDATWEALRIVRPAVEKAGLTLVETALRWLVHHSKLNVLPEKGGGGGGGGNDGVIIGVSSFAQLEGNLKDLEKGPLPDDVVRALDEAWLVTKPTTANYWHLDLEYTYDTKKALFG